MTPEMAPEAYRQTVRETVIVLPDERPGRSCVYYTVQTLARAVSARTLVLQHTHQPSGIDVHT